MDRIVRVVMLRRPRTSSPPDMRSDPFWEFGSFGLTGCHSKNILHPKRADELTGTRLAFAQGGPRAIKLIYLTPPIKVVSHNRLCEAVWDPTEPPFCFTDAPVIIDNYGQSEVPGLKCLIKRVNRTTWMGKFTSAFRTRTVPLPPEIADSLIRAYKQSKTNDHQVVKYYTDALPFTPKKVDQRRRDTYRGLLKKA